MRDPECVEFLRECLPAMGFRWPGFRKVRRQVCRRVSRRLEELGLKDVSAYRAYLDSVSGEWPVLDSLCRVTISRFYRDRGVFGAVSAEVLPELAGKALATGEGELRAWCAGCSSGEEPYTLNIIWKLAVAPSWGRQLNFRILASETDPVLLGRAREGLYTESSLRDMPPELRQEAFDREGETYRIKKEFTEGVEFISQDIRREMPPGPFHMILCRNLAFTYFDQAVQREVLGRILERLRPGGVLIVGIHEKPPGGIGGLVSHEAARGIHRKALS